MTSEVARAREEGKYSGAPEFDVDRVAKELDGVFQSVLTGKISTLDNEAKVRVSKFEEELDVALKVYGKEIQTIFPEIKQRLLDEVIKGRAVIVLPDSAEVAISHMDHPEMENVVKSLHLHNKAMLVGPAGTGKTTMIGHIAERKGLPFYKYSCSRDSSVHDLLGYKQPASETYLETSFLRCYEEGGIFLVDEYDAMSGDMALFFNGIADNSKFISIPHRDDKPTAQKHKDFYLVMCGNTWGKGSTDYSGRDFQDMALMDRFRFCRHHIGYHHALERELMQHNYPFAVALRGALEKVGSYLSTRNVEDISRLIQCDVDPKSIVAMVTQDLSELDKPVILEAVKDITIRKEKITVKCEKGVEYVLDKLIATYPLNNPAKLAELKAGKPVLYSNYLEAMSKINGLSPSREGIPTKR